MAGLGNLSGPERLKRSLLDTAAAAAKAGRELSGAQIASARAAAGGLPGGLSTRRIAGSIGAYATGRRFVQGYADMAAFDRQMTRIGITADATAEQLAEARKKVHDLAFEFGLAQSEAVKGVDALVTQGLSLPEALAQLRPVLAATQASGAAADDMAKSGGALTTNLKVKITELERAFDILAYAGKKGQFELKDMAQYLPTLAASWSNAGQAGIDKLADLAAGLQIIRKQTGSSEQAFNGMRDLLAKLYTPEVQKNFKKAGVDLEGGLKAGLKAGKPLLDVVVELVEKVTKGDLAQLPKFFGEIDSRQAVSALVNLKAEFRSLRAEIKRSSLGTIASDLPPVINDTESSIKRLSDSWSGFWRSAARVVDSAGASTALAKITAGANAAADALDRHNAPGGRAAMAEEFGTNQKRGQLDARIRELEEKLRQRETAVRDAATAPLASFPGRVQSGAKAQADRRAADVSTDAEVKRLREKLNELIQERQNLLGGAKPVITDKDLKPARDQIARDKARDRYFDLYPTLRGNRAAPASMMPPVQPLDAVPLRSLDDVKRKASDAGQALDQLGSKSVAPNVDVAALKEALEVARALKSTLQQIGSMTVSPKVGMPNTKASFGRLGDSTGALFDRA
ncbi:phage tail tape measure protein [Rhodoplanes azumiensis]|uniref:Phage tail tape measure protein n=1 Tax=Rhodoplanes azumiensis TaxID=1897628 RepID=A0ABW5AN41_9BRAD